MKCTKPRTLYERLGGDPGVQLIVFNFFDELVEDRNVGRFFKDVPMQTLCAHQIKFFRTIFGPEEERPNKETYWNYLLQTHQRLFRDCGLNETHFDMVATCFVQGLQTMQVEQSFVDEAVSLLAPLRCIFEYGANCAAKEQKMTEEELSSLPTATAKSIELNTTAVLERGNSLETPVWLADTLDKTSCIRAWTCQLTEKFCVEKGSADIADIFMTMPFLDYHDYLVAFLQLAFLPGDCTGLAPNLIKRVQYPRGEHEGLLNICIWRDMIAQFKKTCLVMAMDVPATTAACLKLAAYGGHFSKSKLVRVNGANARHCLHNDTVSKKTIDNINIISDTKVARRKQAPSVTSSTSASLGTKESKGSEASAGTSSKRSFLKLRRSKSTSV